MKAYRLVHKDYNGEVVFGLPFPYNQLEGEKKINYLFSKMKPWKHCIPYYKNNKFAFISLDALVTFLYYNGNLTNNEASNIENNFYIESFDLTAWSSGLSKFLCTYFEDEIDVESHIEKLQLKDLLNIKENYNYISQDSVPEEDIKLVKEQYYQNIKTYY